MFSTTGATVYMHYCTGTLVDWKLNEKDLERCGNCSKEKESKNDCCKDEIKVLKIDEADRHPEASDNQLSFKDVILPIAYFAIKHQIFPISDKKFLPEYFAINRTVPDLCVLHCTYLI